MGHRQTAWNDLLESRLGLLPFLDSLGFGENKVVVKDEQMVNKERAEALNTLIQEVRNGDRLPDEAWYWQFRSEATEGGVNRIAEHQKKAALDAHNLLYMLLDVSASVDFAARAYKARVFDRATKSRRMTRLELLQASHRGLIPNAAKGQVFCVADPDSATGFDYVCSTSVLLVRGALLDRTIRDVDRYRASQGSEDPLDVAMRNVRFEWCYGGLSGERAFEERISGVAPSLFTSETSPYLMDVPLSVLDKARQKYTGDWLKCAPFSYADLKWQIPKKQATTKEEPVSTADAGGGDKSDDILSKIPGLVYKLLGLLVPEFGKVSDEVKKIVNLGSAFYDRWVGKYVEKTKAKWDERSAKLGALKGNVEKATDARDKARDEAHAAEVKKVGDPKNPKAASDYGAKRAILKERETELTAAETELANEKKQPVFAEGSGELLGEMLDDIVNETTALAMSILDPYASKLFKKGFAYVVKLLDFVVNPIISMLGGIPWAGSLLVAGAKMAYDAGKEWLGEWGYEQLKGLMERLLAKTNRAISAPIFAATKKAIVGLLQAVCSVKYPEVCSTGKGSQVKLTAIPPKDRWIERALACAENRPIITKRMLREGEKAHRDLLALVDRVRSKPLVYARGFANRYLARIGHTYDTWMAAVSRRPSSELRAEAAKLSRLAGASGRLGVW